MPDIVHPLAFIFEIAGAGDGVFAAGETLGQRRKRIALPLIANCLIIYDGTLDLRVIAVFDLFSGLHVAHGKSEGRLALLVFGVNFLGGFLCLILGPVHGDPLQLVRAAVDLCDGLQNGIGVLR